MNREGRSNRVRVFSIALWRPARLEISDTMKMLHFISLTPQPQQPWSPHIPCASP